MDSAAFRQLYMNGGGRMLVANVGVRKVLIGVLGAVLLFFARGPIFAGERFYPRAAGKRKRNIPEDVKPIDVGKVDEVGAFLLMHATSLSGSISISDTLILKAPDSETKRVLLCAAEIFKKNLSFCSLKADRLCDLVAQIYHLGRKTMGEVGHFLWDFSSESGKKTTKSKDSNPPDLQKAVIQFAKKWLQKIQTERGAEEKEKLSWFIQGCWCAYVLLWNVCGFVDKKKSTWIWRPRPEQGGLVWFAKVCKYLRTIAATPLQKTIALWYTALADMLSCKWDKAKTHLQLLRNLQGSSGIQTMATHIQQMIESTNNVHRCKARCCAILQTLVPSVNSVFILKWGPKKLHIPALFDALENPPAYLYPDAWARLKALLKVRYRWQAHLWLLTHFKTFGLDISDKEVLSLLIASAKSILNDPAASDESKKQARIFLESLKHKK